MLQLIKSFKYQKYFIVFNTSYYSSVLYLMFVFLLAHCTNGRQPTGTPIQMMPNASGAGTAGPYGLSGMLQGVSSIPSLQSATVNNLLITPSGLLIATGTPFGLAMYWLAQAPLTPVGIFAASSNPTQFEMEGLPWSATMYGSGGLATDGSLIYTSGMVGLSVIANVSNTYAEEVNRFPAYNPQVGPIATPEFEFTAIVPHPTLSNILFGFTAGLNELETLELSNGGQNVTITSQVPYSSTGMMLPPNSATYFNGNIYAAFQNQMGVFPVSASSLQGITSATTYTSLFAHNVAATQRFLYVENEPIPGYASVSSAPQGLYVFSTTGQNVAFFPIPAPFAHFAISPDDKYLYAILQGTPGVQIFTIGWSMGN